MSSTDSNLAGVLVTLYDCVCHRQPFFLGVAIADVNSGPGSHSHTPTHTHTRKAHNQNTQDYNLLPVSPLTEKCMKSARPHVRLTSVFGLGQVFFNPMPTAERESKENVIVICHAVRRIH